MTDGNKKNKSKLILELTLLYSYWMASFSLTVFVTTPSRSLVKHQTLAIPCQPTTCYRSIDIFCHFPRLSFGHHSDSNKEGRAVTWAVRPFRRFTVSPGTVLIALAQVNLISVSLDYHDHNCIGVLDSSLKSAPGCKIKLPGHSPNCRRRVLYCILAA